MINLKNLFIPTFLCFLFLNSVFSQQLNIINSKLNRCKTCHSNSGNSTTPIWPKLAGQHSEYMLKQMFEFKKGKEGRRFDPTMFGMLQGVTENEMVQLSNYFSRQTIERTRIKKDKNKIETGRRIYFFGKNETSIPACVGCHSVDGYGNKVANFPSLKWQHRDYLLIQLKKFKTNDRSNDVNSVMRDIASSMSNDDMEAVSMYIALMD